MNIFYRLKKDRVLFALLLLCAIILIFEVTVLVYDIVQMAMILANSTALSPAFLVLNIVATALLALAVSLIAIYVAKRKV